MFTIETEVDESHSPIPKHLPMPEAFYSVGISVLVMTDFVVFKAFLCCHT